MELKSKDILINGSLAIGSVVLLFAIAEMGLRVTGLQTVKPNPPKIYQTSEDSRISIELIPNISRKAYREKVTINSLGFRSPEIDPSKPTIAVLGDSITFGYGLKDDETIPAQIQKNFPEYNILNTAAPAYQLLQQTAVYETKVQPLKSEALVLIFYWNDFTDKTPFLDDQGIVRDEDWEPTVSDCNPVRNGPLALVPGQCWLEGHSAFYKVFKKLISMRYANEKLKQQRAQSQKQPIIDSVTSDDLALYAEQLSALNTLLPKELPRLFVIWPDRYLHKISRPQLAEIADQNGFKVLDLYDVFGNEVPTLGWDTVHPSAEAAAKAGELIADVLIELLHEKSSM